ncbi:MAG: AraC family transcriptional regulator [Opitutales bacterium]|nr:AraC family transcriptional regulator [Opitutales bacterium]
MNSKRGHPCALVGASRSTLDRRFREALGSTLPECIEKHCVEQTKTLLHESHLRITDLAAATGFGDNRMLIVAFHRVTGENPGRFG